MSFDQGYIHRMGWGWDGGPGVGANVEGDHRFVVMYMYSFVPETS